MKTHKYQNTITDEEVNMIKRTITATKDTLVKKNRKPKTKLPVEKITLKDANSADNQVAWLGHSSVFLKLNGKTILIDPVFSNSASPLSFVICRFQKEIPLDCHILDEIDMILLTHNHYDHLDKKTIKQLHERTRIFLAPIGVKRTLVEWGVAADKIVECGWEERFEYGGIEFISQETQHNSRRSLFDRNTTLWCGWVIRTESLNIYFSGDSGYGNHFKRTGDMYGPFDFAMVECGQYDIRWPSLHMFPEQTFQATVDLQTKIMLPIHWGSFTLAFHPWHESIDRVLQLKKERRPDFLITTPKLGELIDLLGSQFPMNHWWKDFVVSNNRKRGKI